MTSTRALCALFVGTLCFSHAAPIALAAAEKSENISIVQQTDIPVRGDFQVGPARFTVELAPGEEKSIEVQITSREGEPRTYSVYAEDFSVKSDGSDSFDFYGKKDGPFSARSWLSPAISELSLKHGQRAFLPVKVRAPLDASAGDHYAVILFERQKLPIETASIGVLSRVGAIVLITVKGPVVEAGSLQSFRSASPFYWKFPASFTLEYKNTGTVHLVPKGYITIKNIFGITVDKFPLKDWYVLRESTRTREIFWKPKFALGRYTAIVETQARSLPTETTSFSFWVLPAVPVSIATALVFALSFGVQFFLSRFEIRKK